MRRDASLPPKRELLWSEFRMLTLVVAVVAAAAVFVLATGVFLLAFASVLVAVVLHDAAAVLERHTPLSLTWSLAAVFVLVLGSFGLFAWFTAPNIIDQVTQVTERVPQALDVIDDRVSDWLGWVPDRSIRELLPAARSFLGTLPMIVNTTLGVLGSLAVVLALGVFLAAHPQRYRDGVVNLFASNRRDDVRETLDDIGEALRGWLRGQLLAMVVMGVASYAVLSALGVPLALSLAFLTGLMELVPYVGAIVAAVPVLLVALTESWQLAFYALLAYTALQTLEGYAMIPLIQRRAISVAPAVIIFMQVLMGVLFGVVGIVLATPLCAALAVLVRRCYLRGVLEDDEHGVGSADQAQPGPDAGR